MLPISVLVPSRNSMSLLPGHVEAMRAWLDLVEEVVAVDSHSTDGTLEFLQRELKHPQTRVLTHPPGLYQSWNFGLAQCRAKYIYISTVGETITRDGLSELLATAEMLVADVVISPPRMVQMDGRPKDKEWPIHTLLQAVEATSPFGLAGAAAQLLAVTFVQRGILGSSASNLYRADVLQRFPFRTEFGTAGDLAWGLDHAGEVRWGIVPRSFSTFVFHPKAYAKSDYAVADFALICLEAAEQAVQRRPWAGGGTDATQQETMLGELLQVWREFIVAKRIVQGHKAKSPAWVFSPAAWRAHLERGRKLDRLERAQDRALEEVKRSLIPARLSS